MACTSCGNRGHKQPVKAVAVNAPPVELTPRQFLLSKGWEYQGECSCTPRLGIYQHAQYKDWEVRTNDHQFQIKDITRPIKTTVTSGNHMAFQSTYTRFFET